MELSFARVLKEEVGGILNLTATEIDAQKERALTPEEQERASSFWRGLPGVTIRDLLIARATERRETDPQFYVRYVIQNYCSGATKEYLITDWRFQNEIEFIRQLGRKVITVRVLRSGVAVPPLADGTEHDLDAVETDFILTPPGDIALVPPAYQLYRETWCP